MKMNDANTLLDALKEKMGFRFDAELSKAVGFDRPSISNMRKLRLTVGATFILRAHKASGISVAELEELAGLVKEL
jgi:hypothetical protein